MKPRPRALKQGHADREFCPKQAHAGLLGARPSTVLCPPLPAAIKAKSAVAAWKLCGTLTETDTASFGDLCIKSRACTKVGARKPLVVFFLSADQCVRLPDVLFIDVFHKDLVIVALLRKIVRGRFVTALAQGLVFPLPKVARQRACLRCSVRGLLPCVWVIPGRHVS